MTHQKLILEISDTLLQQLKNLAAATDQSLESLAINCITLSLSQVVDEVQKLDELLAGITPNNLHEEIDFGEPVGREFR